MLFPPASWQRGKALCLGMGTQFVLPWSLIADMSWQVFPKLSSPIPHLPSLSASVGLSFGFPLHDPLSHALAPCKVASGPLIPSH